MIFDLIVIAILFISALIAFFRGFIKETLTIVGVLGGFFASLYGSPLLSPIVQEWIGTETEDGAAKELFGFISYSFMINASCYVVIFIVVVIALSIGSYFLSKSAEAAGLGPVDRSFGVLFGLLRGLILVSLLYLPVYMLVEDDQRDEWFTEVGWTKDSKTRFYIEGASNIMAAMIPERVTDDMEESQEEAEKKSEETRKKLKALEVLKDIKDGTPADQAESSDKEDTGSTSGDTDTTKSKDEAGYNKKQTNELNTLIEENIND